MTIKKLEAFLKDKTRDMVGHRKIIVPQSGDNIYGNHYREWVPAVQGGDWEVDMQLETWEIPFIIGERNTFDDEEYLKLVQKSIEKFETEKFEHISGRTDYKVRQLIDWSWLRDENNRIFYKKVGRGVYQGCLIKYAVLFPDIKWEK